MPSNVLITGFIPQLVPEDPETTYYIQDGFYNLNGLHIWNGTEYVIEGVDSNFTNEQGTVNWYFSQIYLIAGQTVEHPWQVTSWGVQGGSIIPLSAYENMQVTEVLDQPTFGLPADVVALITSRFGTVANFLRLRNLGYI